MTPFQKNNHIIRINKEYDAVEVYQRVASFSIDSQQVKIADNGESYVIGPEACSTCHTEELTIGKIKSTRFEDCDFIGAADIRDMRIASYTYHLDKCPAYFEKDGGVLKISTECADPCTSPKTECRDVQIRECNS